MRLERLLAGLVVVGVLAGPARGAYADSVTAKNAPNADGTSVAARKKLVDDRNSAMADARKYERTRDTVGLAAKNWANAAALSFALHQFDFAAEYYGYAAALSGSPSYADQIKHAMEALREQTDAERQRLNDIAVTETQRANTAETSAKEWKEEADKANERADKANERADKANERADKANERADKANERADKANERADEAETLAAQTQQTAAAALATLAAERMVAFASGIGSELSSLSKKLGAAANAANTGGSVR